MTTTNLTGERIEELKAKATTHFWPHMNQAGDMSDETGLNIVTSAKGVWVEDASGKRWLDMVSGMWLKNIGHGRTEIADAVHAQMLDVSFTAHNTVAPSTIELAARVGSLAPDKEARVFFVSGGSEAVETAIKMAKQYQRNRGELNRYKVISRRGSYHGNTQMCMSLGGGGAPPNFGPPVPGYSHISQPNGYRCLYCSDKGGCNLECARDLDRAIEHEGVSTVAAFIGEPISQASGIHIPHQEYWPTIREICDKHGVVMICDEVITGFGRTGKMFATENWNVKPDIFTVAKALTSGYLPIGGAIASKEVADAFIGSEEKTFGHLLTFGGNPASCAAGMANLDIMINEGMVENSARMGDRLYEGLQALYEHRIVGDVRGGMGLLAAVELVKDRDTKEKYPKEAELAKKLGQAFGRHGILGMRIGDVISIAPPLCITGDEIDELVSELNEVVVEVQAAL
jgi:adenosylmethionine-8-amino-7-oxononanoate aminotransferase